MTEKKDFEAVRPVVRDMAKAARDGKMDRREFIALASVLGVGAATSYGLLGATLPGAAHAQEPKRGGVLRVGMRILDIDDPRLYDWTEKGNVARQFCEPLVRWKHRLLSFSGMLLEELGGVGRRHRSTR